MTLSKHSAVVYDQTRYNLVLADPATLVNYKVTYLKYFQHKFVWCHIKYLYQFSPKIKNKTNGNIWVLIPIQTKCDNITSWKHTILYVPVELCSERVYFVWQFASITSQTGWSLHLWEQVASFWGWSSQILGYGSHLKTKGSWLKNVRNSGSIDIHLNIIMYQNMMTSTF